MNYYHGTNEEFTLHSGLCLADYERAAADYGRTVIQVRVATEGLNIRRVEITQDMHDNSEYPADRATEREALIADGVDALEFADSTETGREHQTLRLLSEKALAAVEVA